MQIVFDPAKDQVNREKHGVSVSLAAGLDWSTEIATQDVRRDYGEIRIKAHLGVGPASIVLCTPTGMGFVESSA